MVAGNQDNIDILTTLLVESQAETLLQKLSRANYFSKAKRPDDSRLDLEEEGGSTAPRSQKASDIQPKRNIRQSLLSICAKMTKRPQLRRFFQFLQFKGNPSQASFFSRRNTGQPPKRHNLCSLPKGRASNKWDRHFAPPPPRSFCSGFGFLLFYLKSFCLRCSLCGYGSNIGTQNGPLANGHNDSNPFFPAWYNTASFFLKIGQVCFLFFLIGECATCSLQGAQSAAGSGSPRPPGRAGPRRRRRGAGPPLGPRRSRSCGPSKSSVHRRVAPKISSRGLPNTLGPAIRVIRSHPLLQLPAAAEPPR